MVFKSQKQNLSLAQQNGIWSENKSCIYKHWQKEEEWLHQNSRQYDHFAERGQGIFSSCPKMEEEHTSPSKVEELWSCWVGRCCEKVLFLPSVSNPKQELVVGRASWSIFLEAANKESPFLPISSLAMKQKNHLRKGLRLPEVHTSYELQKKKPGPPCVFKDQSWNLKLMESSREVYCCIWAGFKILNTSYYTDWFRGNLLMVYSNPYKTG